MLAAQGQIFELKDGAGTVAPIVLKAAKKAALISDLEREWGVGQKIATLADEHGNLPGFMKVGPALRRPDGKIVGEGLPTLSPDPTPKPYHPDSNLTSVVPDPEGSFASLPQR